MSRSAVRLVAPALVSFALLSSLFGQKAIPPVSEAKSSETESSKPASSKTDADAAKKPDYSQEALVLEQLRREYRFENDGIGYNTVDARWRVQTQAGVQQLGQLVFGYNSANEKLEVVYLRVRKPDGTIVNASAENFQDVPSQIEREAPSYTDYRERHVTVAALRPGDVLEYEIKTQIFTPLIPKQFWFEHSFSKEVISLDEALELNIPKGREIKLKNKPGFTPKVTEQGDRKIYRWTSTYLKRESDEELKKKRRRQAREDYAPDVQLTTFHSWEEMGAWYASLQRTQMDPAPEVRAKVADLTKGLNTDLEKITAIYDFVAQEYRYVSLSFGVGRYQPHVSGDIFSNKYGDCKDKHTLFSSMMKAAGYTVQPVLIGSARKLDPEVPSPSQFDHVISLIVLKPDAGAKADNLLWADTTTEIAPFGLLSYNIRKKQALLASLEGPSKLVETPANPPFLGKQDFIVEGTVSDLGKLKATMKGSFRGDAELAMRAIFRSVPETKWKEVAQYIAATSGVGGEVSDVKVENLTNTHESFHVNFQLSRPNFLLWSNKSSELLLPLPRVGLNPAGEDDDETAEDKDDPSADADEDDAKLASAEKSAPKKDKPIELGSPYDLKVSLKLELPANYKLRTPVPISVKRDYAEYASKYKVGGQTITAERTMSMKLREIPAERRADYVAFSRSVQADEQQKLFVESLNAAAAGTPVLPKDIKVDELLDSAHDAMQSQNYKVALELLTRASEKEPKHKNVWNMLGDAHMGLREFTEAEAAYRKQIGDHPFDAYAYSALGRSLWSQRRLEDAVRPLQQQLEINPLDGNTHAVLGELYLELKKYQEAAEENEKAVSLDAENGLLHANLGRAYLGLKRDKDAIEAFDKAVELAPNPLLWNNIAYELANSGNNLDRAQQYAESAVSSVASSLRNVSVDRLSMRDMAGVMALGSYWDTLGWVAFKRGDLEKAEKYIRASWQLSQGGEVGDHLAQIFEKKGRKDDAAKLYAEALSGNRPVDDTKQRLAALVGDKKKSTELVEESRPELAKQRTYAVGKLLNKSASADFFIVLSRGKADSKFISGSEELKAYSKQLESLNYGDIFPDETPTKIVRRGRLSCTAASGDCTFVLMQPETITSVN